MSLKNKQLKVSDLSARLEPVAGYYEENLDFSLITTWAQQSENLSTDDQRMIEERLDEALTTLEKALAESRVRQEQARENYLHELENFKEELKRTPRAALARRSERAREILKARLAWQDLSELNNCTCETEEDVRRQLENLCQKATKGSQARALMARETVAGILYRKLQREPRETEITKTVEDTIMVAGNSETYLDDAYEAAPGTSIYQIPRLLQPEKGEICDMRVSAACAETAAVLYRGGGYRNLTKAVEAAELLEN